MFLIRVVLGMKKVCFVYSFKHMFKAYLNSEIGIEISRQIEMYTIRKSSD
jgi:hypothetical protein